MTSGLAPTAAWPENELESVDACPACLSRVSAVLSDDLHDVTFFGAPGRWTMRRCESCRSVYLSPRPTVESISKAYVAYYTHLGVGAVAAAPSASRLRRFRVALRNGYLNARWGYQLAPAYRVGGWLFRALPSLGIRSNFWIRHLAFPGGTPRLLDVGCGHGGLVAHMRDLGWQVDGIDPDPEAIELALAAGIRAHRGTLPEIRDSLVPGYDAVTLSHAIEHLHDLRETLAAAHDLLRPGGVIWIATPNADSIGLRLFGPHWRGLEPPRHIVVLSEGALRSLLEEAGFEAVRAPVCPPRAAWYFKESRTIAARAHERPRARPLTRIAALIDDVLAFLHPGRGEELVFVARKPLGG